MIGKIQEMAVGVWSAQLRSLDSMLEANVVIERNTATGDYKFRYGFLGFGLDTGQWILKRYPALE